ncbi:MAG: nucleotidyl transferase AbiEii/AbiGii toxin family protein [bacterium]
MKIQVLTKSQKKLLKEISLFSAMKNDFFLTGGTALSAFYLQHRYSEDLDFFTAVFMFQLEKK